MMKFDWSLDLGPMNIWCEFEEDSLKTALWSAHKKKRSWSPCGHECHLWMGTMYWGRDTGPMNIWCRFEKDQLKNLLCRCTQEKMKLAPISGLECNIWGAEIDWSLVIMVY